MTTVETSTMLSTMSSTSSLLDGYGNGLHVAANANLCFGGSSLENDKMKGGDSGHLRGYIILKCLKQNHNAS